MHGRKSARCRLYGRILMDYRLNASFPKTRRDGLRSKAERAGVEYLLPSVQGWPHDHRFPSELFFFARQSA
jgi:hypothetical protein